ncbi:glycosyltransferase family 39 protein [Nocardia iowensis]|uniref:Glycosyltransferase family 39 protein n=1 Tax=Nocardia iowensis TaxID=204891 RepID=A0ABX8RPH0_NOCIO|nr:glycosyltransferase family 39 protein [Nocardia iowensis]QXN90185.1 glycosyltransferase family 39 protein [Nocardia iowensis]
MPVVAALFAVVLTACAPRYGYHRDELYFLAAGRHLSWGYPDQPPLTPLLAEAMAAIDPDSLFVLRLPAVLAATLVVVCAGLMAREFGGGRGAQALAAAAVASAALVMGAGHMLSTAVIDLAVWSVVSVLMLVLLRGRGGGGDPRWWPVIGVVVGIGWQNKLLLIFPVLALLVSLLALGPRKLFATKFFPMAIGIAILIWLPYLVWQARNGWPQWEMGRAIAGGSSGTSDSPIMFVLLQFGLMGPLLVPLWAFGLWRLARDSRYRASAATYGLLFALFLVTGGKAYYLGGMYPILLAAGAVPVAAWLGRARTRWAAVSFVVAVNAAISAVLFLPVLPVSMLKDTPVLAVNYDAGETIGWPEFTRQVGEARARLGRDVTILTANYGEAAAIERFGAPYDLPKPHSGHNSYWWWGPPSDTATDVLTIGIEHDQLTRICTDIHPAGHIDNALDIDNDEQGEPLFHCRIRAPWSQLWPQLKHLG